MKRLIPYGLIVFASATVYSGALSNGFVYDDIFQIVENPWIKDIRHIPEIFSKSVWSFNPVFVVFPDAYYRPLMYITYMLTYYIFGLHAWGFHLVNILFHAGNAVLVFIVISRLLGGSEGRPVLPALSAALLFAVHPVNSETVIWPACIPELSLSFFLLLSLYFHMRSNMHSDAALGRDSILSALFFFLAALSKETALILPVIAIAYDISARRGKTRFGGLFKHYLLYLIAAGLYIVMRSYALETGAPERHHASAGIFRSLLNIMPLFMQYLEKLLLPVNLSAFHDINAVFSFKEIKGIVSLLFMAVFVTAAFLSLRREKLFFACMLIVVPLMPAFYLSYLVGGYFAERFLYLSSVGFVMLMSLIAAKAERGRMAKVAVIGLFVAVFGVYSAGTMARIPVWKNNESLFEDMIRKYPGSARPHELYGVELMKKGRLDEGRRHLEAAFRLNPAMVDLIIYEGSGYADRGLINEALFQFAVAVMLKPDSSEAHYHLGRAYIEKGWTEQAIEEFQTVLKIQPGHAEAHNELGIAYAQKGFPDRAIGHFREASRLSPGTEAYRINLEEAYSMKRRRR